MSSFEIKPGDGAGGATISIIVVAWILVVMTAALIFQAYTHADHYEIPQFLIEIFERLCDIAVGGTAIGAGVAFALHKTNKKIEVAKKEIEEAVAPLLEQQKD